MSRLREWYRAHVPMALRRPLSRVRSRPRDALARSSRLGRTARGRHLQAGLHRRDLERQRQAPELLAASQRRAVAEDVALVERRITRQHAEQTRHSFVAAHLEARHDHHLNRCSPAHLRSMHERFADEDLLGRTVLEVGVGSANPYALLVLFVLLGADRAIGLDLADVEDELVAARAAAMTFSWMLTAPQMLTGDHAIDRALVADRTAEVDVERLWHGDLGAFDGWRVEVRQRSADDTGLDDGSVDLVLSNSVLEHLEHPEACFAELARVTRPGGRACHVIDASDHHHYVVDGLDQLAFLDVPGDPVLVNGSNRLRPHQLAEQVAASGFVVDELQPTIEVEVDDAQRAGFVEPYRSMPLEQLAVTHARLRAHRPSEAGARPGR